MDYQVRVYDKDGNNVCRQWFQTKYAPLQQAGKLVRSIRNAVSYEILEDGVEPIANQYDLFGSGTAVVEQEVK